MSRHDTLAGVRGTFNPDKTFTVMWMDPVWFVPVKARRRFAGLTETGAVRLADNNGNVTGETTSPEFIRAYH